MEHKPLDVKKHFEDNSIEGEQTTGTGHVCITSSSQTSSKTTQLKLKELLQSAIETKKSSTCSVYSISNPAEVGAAFNSKAPLSSGNNLTGATISTSAGKPTFILRASDYLSNSSFTRRSTKKSTESTQIKKIVAKSFLPVKSELNSTSGNLTSSSVSLGLTVSQGETLLVSGLAVKPTHPARTGLPCHTQTSSAAGRQSQSIIAHILCGEDKQFGQHHFLGKVNKDVGTYVSVPGDKSSASPERDGNEKVLDSLVDGGTCTDSELRSLMYESLFDGSGLPRLGDTGDWEMDTGVPVSTNSPREILPCPVNPTGGMGHMISSLLIRDERRDDKLREDIEQVLQNPRIRVVTPKEAMNVCEKESFQIIWIQLTILAQQELLDVTTSLRYSSMKNKDAYVIAVTDRQPEGDPPSFMDLHMRGIDEVLVGPLSRATIQQKYTKLKLVSAPPKLACNDTPAAVTEPPNTPESTISLESMRNAEYSTDPASSPSWCRVEHATKEKQRRMSRRRFVTTLVLALCLASLERLRRERIKDSCDQLRVLLPYVRGRKTDMASILEMTVDYLKIVNAALPQDFQTLVIDIMSHGSPLLEGRIADLEMTSMASKKMSRRKSSGLDLSPLGRPLDDVESKVQLQTIGVIKPDQLGDKRVMTRSQSRSASSTFSTNLQNDRTNNNSNSIISSINNNNSSNSNSGETNPGSGVVNGRSSSSNDNSFLNNTEILTPKRECPSITMPGHSKAKRPHLSILAPGDDQVPSVVYLPTGTVKPLTKDTKKAENVFDDLTAQSYPYANLQFNHMFTEGDISANRMFSTGHSDHFPYQSHAQFNMAAASRVGCASSNAGGGGVMGSDMAAAYGGMYAFDGAYYHYYPSLQDSSNGNYYMPGGGTNEFVNPNAVLPMTSYAPRVSAFSSRSFERTSVNDLECLGVTDGSDLYNNHSNNNSNNSSSSSSNNNNNISYIGQNVKSSTS